MQVTGHRSLAMIERYNVKTTREAAKALTAHDATPSGKARTTLPGNANTNTDTRGLSA
jgi:hypothetical protein